MKNRKRTIIATAITTVVILIAIPYLRVEYMSAKHGDTFAKSYHGTGMFEDIEYLKVMEYSEREAKVYYVLSKKVAGILAEFENRNGIWKLTGWGAIWSTSGSADGFIWPYYR